MRLLAAPCRREAGGIACLTAVMEAIRAEARQYLLEIEDERLTLSCAVRPLVCVQTRSEVADEPASTPADVYWDGFEFTCHSMMPAGAATRSTVAPPKQPLSSSHTRLAFNAPGASPGPAASRPIGSLHRNA